LRCHGSEFRHRPCRARHGQLHPRLHRRQPQGVTPLPAMTGADRFSAALERTFILAGPTAVGKTALAVALARELDAEIVGADAFQVYDGLRILTAQPTPEERAAVPHHLIGVVPLPEPFNAQRYLELARRAMVEIHARG